MKTLSSILLENIHNNSICDYMIMEYMGVSEPVKILTDYLFNELKRYVYSDPKDDKYDNLLYELYKKCCDAYDGYPIEINFKKVKGFNPKQFDLLTFKDLKGDWSDVKCDMILMIDSNCDGFGSMDIEKPLLSINPKYIKTRKTFERNIANIRNTLGHELIHYIQHMSKKSKGLTNVKWDNESSYIADVIQNNILYRTVEFVLYSINPIEEEARKQGFYETIKIELEKRLKQYKKQIKQTGENFTIEGLIKFIMYHKDYHDDLLHTEVFDIFLDKVKEDTWEDYKKCFDDANNKYRDDSIIYILLNIADNRSSKPYLYMPSNDNFVMHINSQDAFDKYKKKLVWGIEKNLNKYKNKIKKVIYSVIEETGILKNNTKK